MKTLTDTACRGILILAIIISVASFSNELLGENSQLNDGPNIIILLADDLGYRDLSTYGSMQVHTPAIDQLAEEGIKFTDFYAGSAVCSPSRAALLTGRSSLRAGIYSWIHPSQKMHLHRDEITIAEKLKNKGYSTAHIGKWHLGYDLEEGTGPGPNPADQGFDYWMATGNNARPSHHNPDNFVKNGKAVGVMEGYSSGLVVDEAIDWLSDKRDKSEPFFLNLWFHEPHAPVAAPPKITERHQNSAKPAYYGSIENMDSAIGRLLDKLVEMGENKKTIIFFMSDNGSYMGEHGSNGELKKGKTTLWEGGIRVPGIIRWPGYIEAGTVERRPAGIVDLFPTVMDIIDAELPSGRTIDGESLVPLFKDEPFVREQPLYWFYSPSRPMVVVRDGPWCLMADPTLDISRDNLFNEEWIGKIKKTGLENFRLFNLRKDPMQNDNVASDNPARFESMKKKLIRLHKETVEEAIDWRHFEWP